MHAAEHLAEHVWKHPECYGGFSPDGDYLILSRNRDSSLVAEVNWQVACESLKAEAFDGGRRYPEQRPAVYHWRAGCSLVGWVEYLCVRPDADEATLTKAGEIICSLADHPILSEDRYSAAEDEAVCKYWESCRVRERVEYLQEAGMCIFAARRDSLPDDPAGRLYERLSVGL